MTEQVDRQLKTLALAEKLGQLVAVPLLEAELQRMVVAMRTELLSRDDKLKAEIDALYSVDVDVGLLNEHTYAALRQLARYDPERAGTDPSTGVDDDAAGGDDDDVLGARTPPAEPESDGAPGALQP